MPYPRFSIMSLYQDEKVYLADNFEKIKEINNTGNIPGEEILDDLEAGSSLIFSALPAGDTALQ